MTTVADAAADGLAAERRYHRPLFVQRHEGDGRFRPDAEEPVCSAVTQGYRDVAHWVWADRHHDIFYLQLGYQRGVAWFVDVPGALHVVSAGVSAPSGKEQDLTRSDMVAFTTQTAHHAPLLEPGWLRIPVVIGAEYPTPTTDFVLLTLRLADAGRLNRVPVRVCRGAPPTNLLILPLLRKGVALERELCGVCAISGDTVYAPNPAARKSRL